MYLTRDKAAPIALTPNAPWYYLSFSPLVSRSLMKRSISLRRIRRLVLDSRTPLSFFCRTYLLTVSADTPSIRATWSIDNSSSSKAYTVPVKNMADYTITQL
jgi:hypothetical protein